MYTWPVLRFGEGLYSPPGLYSPSATISDDGQKSTSKCLSNESGQYSTGSGRVHYDTSPALYNPSAMISDDGNYVRIDAEKLLEALVGQAVCVGRSELVTCVVNLEQKTNCGLAATLALEARLELNLYHQALQAHHETLM
jgi:hypothetical protein